MVRLPDYTDTVGVCQQIKGTWAVTKQTGVG